MAAAKCGKLNSTEEPSFLFIQGIFQNTEKDSAGSSKCKEGLNLSNTDWSKPSSFYR